MQLQHVNLKLLVNNPGEVDLESLIPVFHSWIQDQPFKELLLDVADYRHVYAGPGMVLIGHEADYSVDNTDNRLGIRYNRKAALDGGNHECLHQAARAVLMACQRLEEDSRVGGKLRFNGQDIELFINDRLLVPNGEVAREAVRPDLEVFFQKLFGGSEYSLSHHSDPRRLFAVSVKSSNTFAVADLLANLDS